MIKVKPQITTTVAEDVFNPNGSLWIPKGSFVSHASHFKTKKFGDFTLVTPNPITVFLAGAEYLINKIGEISNKIDQDKRIIVFSKLNDGTNKFTTDELIKLDPESKTIRKLDSDDLFTYLELSTSYLILLINAVESFINQELPNNLQQKVNKDGKEKILHKSDIELQFGLNDKIELLGKHLNMKNYKQESFWVYFRKVKKLRDNLVHLKTKGSVEVDKHTVLFTELFDLDIAKAKSCIVDMINYFIPNYIEDK